MVQSNRPTNEGLELGISMTKISLPSAWRCGHRRGHGTEVQLSNTLPPGTLTVWPHLRSNLVGHGGFQQIMGAVTIHKPCCALHPPCSAGNGARKKAANVHHVYLDVMINSLTSPLTSERHPHQSRGVPQQRRPSSCHAHLTPWDAK